MKNSIICCIIVLISLFIELYCKTLYEVQSINVILKIDSSCKSRCNSKRNKKIIS